ncbi:MAG: tripartite tricarboxylate transporter substrate binding protein [Pigmentiphaga sp.]|uniref:Bug family tripartite tricarboxylate transporter substrate binding protein n=1 Tax=Pigmentiphaga sp. TaxID=1977564 RepID=UPI0029BE3104|nr:tripartite tricarboxylate transporter substrate binding protein [Pigmentiphaga sp.]MDX3907359.1 tripartite tricarboxylate transporter substrate binding protein [Pigmentiphaga sp.]
MRIPTRLVPAMAGTIVSCVSAVAAAQDFPNRMVRIVVPFSAGGVTDVMARGIASELGKTWAQPVVVENKPGANTIIGTEFVAKSPADGYTILMANDPSLSSNQYLYSRLPYDPVRDFTPVVNIAASITVLVAAPSLKADTLQAFIASAKADPGKRTYGSFGLGSATHLSTEEFSALAGIRLNHIPYKGIADVVPAVMSGQIDVALSAVSPVLGAIRGGKLKALAYANPTRSPVMPDVPTFAEQGLPFETRAWFGFAVPAGTPRPVVDKIAADTLRIIETPEFDQKYVSGVGLEPINQGPDAFATFLKQDRARWAERVRRVNVKLD